MPEEKYYTANEYDALDPFNLERVLAGEKVVLGFIGVARREVTLHPLYLDSPRPLTPSHFYYWDINGRAIVITAMAANDATRMSPKPAESRTVYLNFYPTYPLNLAHPSRAAAELNLNSTGSTINLHLVKRDGTWVVDKDAY